MNSRCKKTPRRIWLTEDRSSISALGRIGERSSAAALGRNTGPPTTSPTTSLRGASISHADELPLAAPSMCHTSMVSDVLDRGTPHQQ